MHDLPESEHPGKPEQSSETDLFSRPDSEDLISETLSPEGRPSKAVDAARTAFPRGLHQPEQGYRFSMDALLLATFAAPQGRAKAGRPRRGLDLGTGCGVVGLAFLLEQEAAGAGAGWQITGLDRQEAMVACARANAVRLGLEERFTTLLSDVSEAELKDNWYDAMLCNPPFRHGGQGRSCATAGRNAARFEDEQGLEPFVRAARAALRDKAPLHLVYLPERLPGLFSQLRAARLEPKRMRMVHGHTRARARMVLVESRKNARPGLDVEPPLLLYSGSGAQSPLTREALAFCPFLQCNARSAEADEVR